MTRRRTPTVLSVAGSDPSGGAGVQADLKTFTALGVYGGAVLTALTAQSTRGVTGVHRVPEDFVTAQLDAVLADLDVRAVKTGMLGTADVVEAVAAAVERHRVPALVVDPVMVATSGDRLVDDATVAAIAARLLPLATVVTPNLPETAVLTGGRAPTDEAAMAAAGRTLVAAGARAVLVKGGHLTGAEAVDLLVTREGIERLAAPRVRTRNTHGTGCTLSSAIAARLALGDDLHAAVVFAKAYLTEAVAAGADLEVGGGAGPVDHLVRIRRAAG